MSRRFHSWQQCQDLAKERVDKADEYSLGLKRYLGIKHNQVIEKKASQPKPTMPSEILMPHTPNTLLPRARSGEPIVMDPNLFKLINLYLTDRYALKVGR